MSSLKHFQDILKLLDNCEYLKFKQSDKNNNDISK